MLLPLGRIHHWITQFRTSIPGDPALPSAVVLRRRPALTSIDQASVARSRTQRHGVRIGPARRSRQARAWSTVPAQQGGVPTQLARSGAAIRRSRVADRSVRTAAEDQATTPDPRRREAAFADSRVRKKREPAMVRRHGAKYGLDRDKERMATMVVGGPPQSASRRCRGRTRRNPVADCERCGPSSSRHVTVTTFSFTTGATGRRGRCRITPAW